MISKWTESVGRDLFYRHGTSDITIWHNTFVRAEHLPPEYLNPRTVLDLGANVGYTSAAYQALWPGARIVAVEMDHGNAELCKANFSGTVINAAVVLDGPRRRSYDSGVLPASYALGENGNTEVVALPLEELLETMFFDTHVDFCKMDVEGVEEELLDGIMTWADYIGALLVEVHPYINGFTVEQATRSLEEAGYRVDLVRDTPLTLWAR